MESTVDQTRDDLPLLSAATGFVFAFRVSLTFLWFQDEPQSGTIVWLALSLILLSLATLFTIGSAPNSTTSYRTVPIRWAAALLGFTQLNNAHNGTRLGQALFKIVSQLHITHKVSMVALYFNSTDNHCKLDRMDNMRQRYQQ